MTELVLFLRCVLNRAVETACGQLAGDITVQVLQYYSPGVLVQGFLERRARVRSVQASVGHSK